VKKVFAVSAVIAVIAFVFWQKVEAGASATAQSNETSTPASTPSATPVPIASASASPSASQRRGRLLLPSATPQPTAANSPAAGDTISPIPLTPPPEGLPAGSPQQGKTRGKFESQMRKYNPRKIMPMPSESQLPSAASAASPAAASTPVEKMTKQEEKEQKREEKKESKRERSPGAASPTATP
jgi:hypothetical protein